MILWQAYVHCECTRRGCALSGWVQRMVYTVGVSAWVWVCVCVMGYLFNTFLGTSLFQPVLWGNVQCCVNWPQRQRRLWDPVVGSVCERSVAVVWLLVQRCLKQQRRALSGNRRTHREQNSVAKQPSQSPESQLQLNCESGITLYIKEEKTIALSPLVVSLFIYDLVGESDLSQVFYFFSWCKTAWRKENSQKKP